MRAVVLIALVCAVVAAPAAVNPMKEVARRAAAEAALAAEAASETVDLARRDTHVIWMNPLGLMSYGLDIHMWWDHTRTNMPDMDNILILPGGCVVGQKALTKGYCDMDNGWGYGNMGSPLYSSRILRSDYSYYDSHLMYPNCDQSATSSPSYLRGAELIYLDSPDFGTYHHLVYAYGPYAKWVDTSNSNPAAGVNVWRHYQNGTTVMDFAMSLVTSPCWGRFWNTFRMTITQYDPVVLANYTIVNTITSDPTVATGSSAFQDFEYPRQLPGEGPKNRETDYC